MSDTFITIIAIFLAAILMFIFPLMTLADTNDDITQLTVQTATSEFVDEIRKTGKLTEDKYNSFVSSIAATGNAYDIELQFQILDENPAKKTSQTGNATVIGENIYYSVYTTQIEDRLADDGEYILKEGDLVSVNVKNRGMTLALTLRNIYYKVSGNDTYTIYASAAGTVTVNGK